MPGTHAARRRTLLGAAVGLAVAVLVILGENLALAAWFPHLTRLTTDFSPAYLRRELAWLAAGPPPTIFLGDSVLWGYRLEPRRTAVALLAAQGCTCVNLAFKSGNPPGDYALARLIAGSAIRPRLVVIEVNQAVLNEADDYYQTLHPALTSLAAPYLSSADLARLTLPPPPSPLAASGERAAASVSLLYAMRTDVRETLYGEPPAPPRERLTPELFEGAYDLLPLSGRNVGVHFLQETLAALHRRRIPVLAFLTPTNHGLLHAYIDNRQYARNERFLVGLLQANGARVLDFDRGVPQDEFFDNAHLTAAGQRRLAGDLARGLASAGGPALRSSRT